MATEYRVPIGPAPLGRAGAPPATPPATPHAAPRQQALSHALGVLGRGAEWLYCTVTLCLLAGALLPLLVIRSGGSSAMAEGSPLIRAVFLALYAVALALIALRWKRFFRVVRSDPLNLLVVGLLLASALWSAAPDVTLRRGTAMLLTTLFGWYLAARYSPASGLRLLVSAAVLGLVLSLLIALVLPEYGISAGVEGIRWNGAFSHKNVLGKFAALSVLLLTLQWWSERRGRWVARPALVLGLVLVILSKSATALVLVGTGLLLFPLLGVLRWRLSRGVPALAMATLLLGSVALVVVANAETVAGALNRDLTLTGRTGLWGILFQVGRDHVWLGSGYSAFWGDQNAQVAWVREEAGWAAGGGHNGFLDLWLELGLVGVLCVAAALLTSARAALAAVRRNAHPAAAWPLVLIVFFVLSNLTESSLLRSNTLLWAGYAMAAASARRVPATGSESDR
jgi:O-antigen ligase